MKRIHKLNPYGYKIGYQENNGVFVRHFIVRTYKDAVRFLPGFKKYADKAHDDNHILINPIWSIRPIRFSEYARGIWRECPF